MRKDLRIEHLARRAIERGCRLDIGPKHGGPPYVLRYKDGTRRPFRSRDALAMALDCPACSPRQDSQGGHTCGEVS